MSRCSVILSVPYRGLTELLDNHRAFLHNLHMRTEIVGDYTSKLSIQQLIDRYTQMGYTYLAQGHYAAVFTIRNDPNWVLKVFPPDDGYFLFVKAIEEKKLKGTAFPKIRNLTLHTTTDGHRMWYSVEIERLDPCWPRKGSSESVKFKGYTVTDEYDYDLSRLIRGAGVYTHLHRYGNRRWDWEDYENIIKYKLSRSERKCLRMLAKLHDRCTSKIETLRLDLHGGNFMRRHNTLVIIDPFNIIGTTMNSSYRSFDPAFASGEKK